MSYPLPSHLERSVRISWHITSWCNYSCDYCPVLVFHKRSKNGDKRNHAFDHYTADQWLEAFRTRFTDQDILLRITGGEPFLDRENFRKILLGVLAMPEWSIQIDTNGSWDPEYFRDVPKDKLGLNIAFHPHMVTFDAFQQLYRSIAGCDGDTAAVARLWLDAQAEKPDAVLARAKAAGSLTCDAE